MALMGWILAVAVGWLGWTKWLCIPLAIFIYIGVYRIYGEQRMQRVAPAAIVITPLLALLLMWLGSLLPGAR